MKNKSNKQARANKKKEKSDNVFGCDLTEHLQSSGHDVPQVLKKCAEFIEQHGVVDGIYRLSGVTSNIQRLRQEFSSEASLDLTKEVYLQDIHCVGSLCKLYFRELPIPLLTYQLYNNFTEAVSIQDDHEKLLRIQGAIKELPVPHFRTLEVLAKHLAHLATLSSETNMHTRNLALVWAPNLLRSKNIEGSSCNGDMAFQEVRIQQSVVEFILNHTEQIFNHATMTPKPKEGPGGVGGGVGAASCGEKYATLPITTVGLQCGPMKLMSLEEAQARSLSPNHPLHRERQRENSLPDTSKAMLYHTVIDIGDSKRKFSGKSKWKSIFNLGKSVGESKGKLSRNGSVFIRGLNVTEKAALRPSRSMESLCSLPTDDDRTATGSASSGANGALAPDKKSRTLGSDSLYDLSEQEHDEWADFKGRGVEGEGGATGGCSPHASQRGGGGGGGPAAALSSSLPSQKALPEQLKVFKGDDLRGYKPTSPKSRRMLYPGSSSHQPSSSRPSFPGRIFPLESSPRHQRKAVNISEPFAVSVPLRVSAVISSNSTPCRGPGKDSKPTAPAPVTAALKPAREAAAAAALSEHGDGGAVGLGSSPPPPPPGRESQGSSEEKSTRGRQEDWSGDMQEAQRGRTDTAELEASSISSPREDKDTAPSPGKALHNQPMETQLEKGSSHSGNELWSDDLHQELKITEPELDILEETFKPVFCSSTTWEDVRLKPNVHPKRRCSSPTLSLFYREQQASGATAADLFPSAGAHPARKQHSESDILFSFDKEFEFPLDENTKKPQPRPLDPSDKKEDKPHRVSPNIPPLKMDGAGDTTHWKDVPGARTGLELPSESHAVEALPTGNASADTEPSTAAAIPEEPGKCEVPQTDKKSPGEAPAKDATREIVKGVQRLSLRLKDRPRTLLLPNLDDEDVRGSVGNLEELDLVESWEDLSSTKQWVTSPLHEPTISELFASVLAAEGLSSKEGSALLPSSKCNKEPYKPCPAKGTELVSGSNSLASGGKPEIKGTPSQPLPTRLGAAGSNTTQTHVAAKPKPQRFHRQASHEAAASPSERRPENCPTAKHRPTSLNLDLGHRCIRDISNQQSHNPSDLTSCQRGSLTPSGTGTSGGGGLPPELEQFLGDRQAPLRRNSAPPVSVASVRTAYMIKTCQAKAVPVIPPKVQYSQIPHSRHEKDAAGAGTKGQEKERPKVSAAAAATEKKKPNNNVAPPPTPRTAADLKEELENKEPAEHHQRQASGAEKTTEATTKTASSPSPAPELPVMRRKNNNNTPKVDVFVDCPARANRANLLQRPSFRNRQRPQSLILLSPPFPIMDYPSSVVGGDDHHHHHHGKTPLSPLKSLPDPSALHHGVFSREMAESLRTPEGTLALQNKMTIPKSGQRLETSTSCFYQPQRRSMIFDSRSHRQIE